MKYSKQNSDTILSCDKCHNMIINHNYKYCPFCGKKIKASFFLLL